MQKIIFLCIRWWWLYVLDELSYRFNTEENILKEISKILTNWQSVKIATHSYTGYAPAPIPRQVTVVKYNLIWVQIVKYFVTFNVVDKWCMVKVRNDIFVPYFQRNSTKQNRRKVCLSTPHNSHHTKSK